jgi:hypothetical protein
MVHLDEGARNRDIPAYGEAPSAPLACAHRAEHLEEHLEVH